MFPFILSILALLVAIALLIGYLSAYKSIIKVMNKSLIKKYALYLVRWQLSTPILAICLTWLGGLGEWPATILANLIGAILMYPIDNLIFSGDRKKNRRGK